MQPRDDLWRRGSKERIWRKYCGFLDLTVEEFSDIQNRLMMDQINTVYDSKVARKFMQQKPGSVEEFRNTVPLTAYADYAEYLGEKDESALAVKPYRWTCTSGRSGSFKWIPWTDRAADVFADAGIAAAILACAGSKYEVNIKSGMRALANLPPPPYGAGVLPQIMCERIGIFLMPPHEENEDFAARTQRGFAMGLRYGVDLLSSLTSVLVKMGETFAESSGKMKFSLKMLHPGVMQRMLLAVIKTKIEKRNILPRDLWPLKGLIAYGMDTDVYHDKVEYYWGKKPLELYGTTETSTIATQAWNKKYMTFQPYSCFFEFIPSEDYFKGLEDSGYKPSTVLLSELQPGRSYEVVLSSFYGMPLMRYRIGDLIRVMAAEDREAGIRLPQIVFQSRVNDIIDINSFARLDEKTIWQAIADAGIKYEDWTARKEYEKDRPTIRIYVEIKQEIETDRLEKLLHEKLVALDPCYRDIETMLGQRPLRVTLAPVGSFQRYYESKQKAGADLAHLKPPHMNAPDSVIESLMCREFKKSN